MKKWLIVVSTFILLLVMGGVYIFIPAKIIVSESILVNCNTNSASRFLGDRSNWGKWWPNATGTGSASRDSQIDSFQYERYGYRIGRQFPNIIEVVISDDNPGISSWISIGPTGNSDSARIQWECSLLSGLDPVRRLQQSSEARLIGRNMSRILSSLRSYMRKKENIYGMSIGETPTRDSFLVATRAVFSVYPSTIDIYGLSKKLKKYISHEGAKVTGYPMVNVTKSAKDQFLTMLAIPVDRELREEKDIFPKKMLQGKYLVTEVKGGQYSVNKALDQLQNYITDYQRTAIAIPFQSLITDRCKEPDTSKWVTRLYYPVF